ncbi:MAG TPA: PSD1 and planctomycete cytochrome C domain-containing protein [Pirellulaceae bacterium]|jgi:mono/diheme cytochrome c family protein|nr:PSD1 and planctomycete cytochrome C domain-containing protein [Pirellulaceae bacterium]
MLSSRASVRALLSLQSTALVVTAFLVGTATAAAEETLTFERDIRPIFRAHCYDCHGATDEVEGSLDLRLVRFMQTGGDSGAAIVPGQPDESLLLQRIRSGEMPPGDAKVSEAEATLLEKWIAAGAPTARPEPENIGPGLQILPEERAWWAFQPIERPDVPEFPEGARVRTPVDALLLSAMPEGLRFSPDADRRTQMLRVSFDLTGLPPTPERLRRYLADESPDAYERLVDELLDSPHYGERWARHWLDVAGYADSEGGAEADAIRSWAWQYRDYVIRSLNANKPFDRFLHEQLAGDEFAGPISGDLTSEQIELLTATGFLRMAADGTGSGDNSEEARNQIVADTLQIVGSSLLGLSVACAQCHDHRYDPISHTDYFAMRAVFEPALDWKSWRSPPQRLVSLATQAEREQAAQVEAEAQAAVQEKAEKQKRYLAAALDKELEKYEEPLRSQLRSAYETSGNGRTTEQQALLEKYPSVNVTPGVLYQYDQAAADDIKAYDARIAEIRAKKPAERFLRALVEPAGHTPETRLFHRGDFRQPKQVVEPAPLTVLTSEEQYVRFPSDDPSIPTTGRRLAFARWLTGPDNPLTARVLVNRVWLHHFGRGLVETPADFGRLGASPSHPKLLDWLAKEFIWSGWDLKRLHRTIVLSTAYRQSSLRDPEMSAIDEANRFYWRRDVVRLDAEVLRDRAIAVTGELDPASYGPPAPVAVDESGQAIADGPNVRRSLYVQQRRSQPVAILEAFDAPVMTVNCERRPSSTVATQSLMLMNGKFALERSLALARRALGAETADPNDELLAGLPAIAPPLSPLWQFGYGGYDEAAQVVRFVPLPHWKEGVWRGGSELPDPKLGWALLHAKGGHAGMNPEFAVIRRWKAPVSGHARIEGSLHHPSENGDGVRGRIVAGRSGLAGEWVAQHGQVDTSVSDLTVEAGDTIDFVVDCVQNVNSDSFNWNATVTLDPAEGDAIVSNSEAGFHGPAPTEPPLSVGQLADAWEEAYCRPPSREELALAVQFVNRQFAELQLRPRILPEGVSAREQVLANLCQALLTSNEFLYVD